MLKYILQAMVTTDELCRVICVLSALSQLNESGAFALVIKHKRCKDTIIVMTKCDLVTTGADDVRHQIVERVLQSSGEP